MDKPTSRRLGGRVTIREVAEDAGVSVAAVSKVLRDAYGVSEAMRLKVRESMAKLSYRPHSAARGMRGQTYTVGVLMADMKNPFFPELIDGIDDGLAGTQYLPLFGIGHGSSSVETAIVHAMVDRQIDGLIMIGQRLATSDLEAIASEVPVVVIGHHAPDAATFDSANNDDERGGALVVEHLLAQGYRRPAMITLGRNDLGHADVSQKREVGFIDAMRRAGFADDQIRIAPADDGLDDVTATVRALLEGPEPPDAIFGWADYYALEVLSAVRALGFRVPDDIGLIGYDNAAPCAFTQNGLTSVDQFGREIGRQATRLLIERIKGRTQAEHFLVQPKVVLRSSSAARVTQPDA
ncbi:LacI family DNA-binding transcriptional regulator [Devosia sp.]|uniref:LacI family DNA-binding transcriptional regulator n=1 Tax=Devosia sp. TaxID=1871048 RepID=UPI0032652BC4